MDTKLQRIYEHMLDFGLSALAHANYHASFESPENANWNKLSVIQAAHAAEILIKAKIAQEHPLLIFEHIPKPKEQLQRNLELVDLFENGRTIQYQDLPDRLWAVAGIHLPNLSLYKSFGRLRNTIQHFTFPQGRDFSAETLEFIFGVIDPFINQSWGLCAADYNEDYAGIEYFIPGLIGRGITFCVSQEVADEFPNYSSEFEWPENDLEYKQEMEIRFNKAKISI